MMLSSSQLEIKKSEIVESKLWFEGKPMSYKDYPLSRLIIDAKAKIKLLLGGRQISKSITLMGDDLSDIMGYAHRKILYVAPTVDQVRTYSDEKIGDRIKESPDLLKYYVNKSCVQNQGLKTFANGSKITFRAATQPIRGQTMDKIKYDEVQDLTYDKMIIIDETMSGRATGGEKWYAGTPLTIQNIINSLWIESQQITPILVCDNKTHKHYQVPSINNIKQDGIRCAKCNERINVRNAFFKRMGKAEAEIMGFWVPQIVLPLHTENKEKWDTLYKKFCIYPTDKFLNEIMGISAGQGQFLVTEEDLRRCCMAMNGGSFEMWNEMKPYNEHGIREMWAGIDWGVTNRVSFTVLIIGGWDVYANRFRVVYAKKYLDTDPLKENADIVAKLKIFGVQHIVADRGAGHVSNRLIEVNYGRPVLQVYYTNGKDLLTWNKDAGFYSMNRTLSLINTFTQLRENRVWFFDWEVFQFFAPHILAEYYEESEDKTGNAVGKFDHPPEKPDDFLQAFNILYNVWSQNRASDRLQY